MEPSGLLSHPARLAGTSLLRRQSDERLVELARAGHEPAFDAIVHRYRPALLRYCTRILGPERGEDAVQQALAGAHTAMTNSDERELHLRPWLYRIAHNTALNFLRGGRREEVELSDEQFAAAHTPEEAVTERERLESVLQAIAALPRSQRDALLLRELEGRSHEEIGRALGVSSGAARATLFRARAAVRTACSALTPTPLLLRAVEFGDSSSHVAAKAVAGVLAGCAIVGGGAASTGVIGGTHHPVPPAAEAAAPKRAVQANPTTTQPRPQTTAAASVAAATSAPKAPAPVAALKAVKTPKPKKVRRPPAKRPVPVPAAATPAPPHDEHADKPDARGHGAWPPQAHGRPPAAPRPDRGHGAGHGRGHDDADVAPVAPDPAPVPATDEGRRQGHAYGRDRHDEADDHPGGGHGGSPGRSRSDGHP